MKPVFIQGMGGMGDCIHQRAVVRYYLAQDREVYLSTPWPALYHDFPVKLVRNSTSLRTQAKNAAREHAKYVVDHAPPYCEVVRVHYTPDVVRSEGSVLGAMCKAARAPISDFSLPIPAEWDAKLNKLLRPLGVDKPILFYRPLVIRTEWGGCATRNPDPGAYSELAKSIRDQFFVISIADLVVGKEWAVGHALKPDAAFHAGELDIEVLAALAKRSAMVFCSPGFAIILGQAVGTPGVCVFGGYENSSSFTGGATATGTPYLGIDPIQPCDCFSHSHQCRKTLDVPTALAKLRAFTDEATCRKANAAQS